MSPIRAADPFDWLNEHWLMPDPALPTPAKKLWGRQPEQSVSGPDTKKDQLQTSSVVKAIFDSIMSDVHNGVLLPGDHVSDTALSLALGTSRTPVREALQQLRTIGVVEASASRFTRIAVIDGEQAANSILVLAALYGAVLTEVIGRVGDHVIDAMRADNAAFRDSLEIGDPAKIAVTGARFYMQLVTESKNVPLRQSIESVIHVVTLGNQHLDQIVGNAVLAESQEILLAATIAGDLAEARRALEMLTPVPLVST